MSSIKPKGFLENAPVEIVRGEHQSLNVTLRDEVTGDPIDLTSLQTLTANIVSGTTLGFAWGQTTATVNISNTTSGKFSFTISDSQSSGLTAVAGGALQIKYQIGDSVSTVLITNAYSVCNNIA